MGVYHFCTDFFIVGGVIAVKSGNMSFIWLNINSLLPGHKLEWPIFTTAHPVPGHERVKETLTL